MNDPKHNSKSKQELYEEQQFMKAFAEIRGYDSDMAGIKGDLSGLYKRMQDLGWSKNDFNFAKSLMDKDVGQVVADFERKIRIARLFGHTVGRQLELLDEDKAPETERAYEAGLAAGKLRGEMKNPYQPATEEYNEWQRGMNDGNAFLNEDLASAVAAEGGEI